MSKIVSADTITEITRNAARGKKKPGPAPAVDDVKREMFAEINKLCDPEIPKWKDRDPKDVPTEEEKKVYRARSQRRWLREAFKNIPEGFKLAPVLYNRISTEENRDIQREFSNRVRPQFMRYIATHHADDLKDLGMSEHAIDRMKRGLDPADEQGRLYDVNVDHIVERAGSGKMGLEKAVDPLMPKGSKPTYKVNHFSNLILMTESLHNGVKNAINAPQQLPNLKPGQSKWSIMVIPERDEKNPKFVFVPKREEIAQLGIRFRKMSFHDNLDHTGYLIGQSLDELERFSSQPAMKQTLDKLDEIAAEYDMTAAEALAGTGAEAREAKEKIWQAFETAIRKDEDLSRWYHARIRSVLTDAVDAMENRVAEASERGARRSNWNSFMKLYRSQKLKKLRAIAERIPANGSGSILQRLQALDGKIAGIDTARKHEYNGKAANKNNKKKKKKKPANRNTRNAKGQFNGNAKKKTGRKKPTQQRQQQNQNGGGKKSGKKKTSKSSAGNPHRKARRKKNNRGHGR